MDEETKRWVGFNVFDGIGPVRFKLLLDYFGTAAAAWKAPVDTLKKIHLGDKLSEGFDHFRKTYDLDGYLKELREKHVSVLTLTNPKYPKLLKEIPDAPFLLYLKGRKTDPPINLNKTIGVVGTRKITPYGIQVTERLVRDLVANGFTIVSGLAYGVDAVAHRTAIESGGKTIGVLGCGIDIIAVSSNKDLYEKIEHGAGFIVSEVPLGHRPTKGLFPARNRIISGLSLGVIVTEGADDSGALITARNAGEQGRDVFAVPGPITSPYSRGPSILLKNGAKLVESVDDILDELGFSKSGNAKKNAGVKIHGETGEEQKILDCLCDQRMCIDDLVRATRLTISEVSATITVLEMKGIIKDYGEKEYGLT